MPAIDASTPAWRSATTTTAALTTASFTPPVGALLVVLYSCPYASNAMAKPTNSGGAVSWDAAIAVGLNSGTSKSTGIWRGVVTSGAAMTVTETPAGPADSWGMGVVVVTDQAAVNGRIATASSSSGAPSVAVSSLVGSNSLILGVVDDVSAAGSPTIPAGQSGSFNGLTFAWSDGVGGFAGWAQYLTAMNIAAGGSGTLNDTAPTGIIYGFSALEVVDVAGVTSPPFIPRRMPLGV